MTDRYILCEHCHQGGGTLVKTSTGYRHNTCQPETVGQLVDAQHQPLHRKPGLYIARMKLPDLKVGRASTR